MVFIDKKEEKTFKLPRISNEIREKYDFFLKSQATNFTASFTGLTDETALRDYYTFTIDFTEIPEGEYEYTIPNLAKGLLQVGEISHSYSAYTENNVYKEYQG